MNPNPAVPALSIIVPTLDEAPRVAASLAALAPLRDEGVEVIVVDGGSRDATCEVAAPLAERVLVAPRGRAIQMNTGAAVAAGATLLFLHADCRLPTGGAEAIVRARRAGNRFGRFDVSLEGRSPMLPVVSAMMNHRSALTGICTGDQGMFIERDLFHALGGFPPIPLMEDVALSTVLRAAGVRPKRIPDRLVASGRRWDSRGAVKTIALMWSLRYAYWRGADPRDLARRYYGYDSPPGVTLQIFAKPLMPGNVKTRLAATIGNEAAATVYGELVVRTLDTAVAARRAGIVREIELWIAPGSSAGVLSEWSNARSIRLREQHGADLGARMHIALRSSLQAGSPAIVIGTDVPGFDIAYLARAASSLETNDAVVGPAEDGGYVLVGLARDIDMFEGVGWSTPAVMTQTRARLAHAKSRWVELPVLWDIDTQADLARWKAMKDKPGCAVIGEPS